MSSIHPFSSLWDLFTFFQGQKGQAFDICNWFQKHCTDTQSHHNIDFVWEKSKICHLECRPVHVCNKRMAPLVRTFVCLTKKGYFTFNFQSHFGKLALKQRIIDSQHACALCNRKVEEIHIKFR